MNNLAAVSEGFAGADLQALCASAVLCAVRRGFPNAAEAALESVQNAQRVEALAMIKVRGNATRSV